MALEPGMIVYLLGRARSKIDNGDTPDQVAHWLEVEGMSKLEAETAVKQCLKERNVADISGGIWKIAAGLIITVVGYWLVQQVQDPDYRPRRLRGYIGPPFIYIFGISLVVIGAGSIVVALFRRLRKWRE